eukprot:1159361-Pelagomonas_calceolata.AAC.6
MSCALWSAAVLHSTTRNDYTGTAELFDFISHLHGSLPAREACSLHGRADQNRKDETQACVASSKKSKRQEKTSEQRLEKNSKEQTTLDCNAGQGLNCKNWTGGPN